MADTGTAASLRPARRPRLPTRGALLRAALVAALLGLAAAVLHTPSGCPPPRASAPAGSTPQPGPGDDGVPSTTVTPTPSRATDRSPIAAAVAPHRVGEGLPLPAGSVGVPVRLAEPAALAVVRPGARVDLLAASAGSRSGEASLLASGALVLDVVNAGAMDGSAALYLALSPGQAQRTVGQPEGSRFAVVVRG
ncbi:flagellar biosynthesis protein FlgA [Micromonospora sp. 15K316]|uniref:flagellar biosynthesis protein FlgA n=1 Tax=Micromonospora sp. 15K316 TaxID=2530376 RepID=UPI00105392D3|nr:flagellar biosynthesis protein FlgA [Micromonospora sp. 15K316]TDC35742.1 flagellar biosynthesis protein FlgA [Micromonospora sp. 15K316]